MTDPNGNTYKNLSGEQYHPSYFQLIDDFLANAPAQRLNELFYDRVGESFCLTQQEKENPPHLGHWFVKPENAGELNSWDVILPFTFRGKRFEVRIPWPDGNGRRCALLAERGVDSVLRRKFAWAFTATFAARYWEDYRDVMLKPTE